MATIRLSVETNDGEITVSRNAWDGKIHIAIKDEEPVSKEVLLDCLDKIEAELKGARNESPKIYTTYHGKG